ETTLAYRDGTAVIGGPAGMSVRPVAPDTMLPGTISSNWYVAPDDELAALPTMGRDYAPATLWHYDWPEAMSRGRFERELYELGSGAPVVEVSGRLMGMRMVNDMFGLSMFAGLFVSLLFFIGAGSLIYFKLFTELESDRRLFERLRRLGITPGETSRTVTAQIAAVFLLPFALGGLHALVALDALGGLLMVD